MSDGQAIVEALWDVARVAKYLRKSVRWVFLALRVPATEEGSIPHTRIGRSPRFDPATMREWVRLGCPPAEEIALRQGRRRRLT